MLGDVDEPAALRPASGRRAIRSRAQQRVRRIAPNPRQTGGLRARTGTAWLATDAELRRRGRLRLRNSPDAPSGIKPCRPGTRPNIAAASGARDSPSNGGRHGPLHERTAGRRRLLLELEELGG